MSLQNNRNDARLAGPLVCILILITACEDSNRAAPGPEVDAHGRTVYGCTQVDRTLGNVRVLVVGIARSTSAADRITVGLVDLSDGSLVAESAARAGENEVSLRLDDIGARRRFAVRATFQRAGAETVKTAEIEFDPRTVARRDR